jgi:hypothetical protein
MKNKLTLKALKQELDLIKARSSKNGKNTVAAPPGVESHKSSVAHDIKNSYIQNLTMKSSMLYLWLITAVIGYAHKLPYIGRIIGFLSIVYGRTTIIN